MVKIIRTIANYFHGRRKVIDNSVDIPEVARTLEELKGGILVNYRHIDVHRRPYGSFEVPHPLRPAEYEEHIQDHPAISHSTALGLLEKHLAILHGHIFLKGRHQIYGGKRGERHYIDLEFIAPRGKTTIDFFVAE